MKYIITYGARNETIQLDLADITDAVEIMSAAYAKLQTWKAAYLVLAAVHEGKFEEKI